MLFIELAFAASTAGMMAMSAASTSRVRVTRWTTSGLSYIYTSADVLMQQSDSDEEVEVAGENATME
jgi:hypothetical protein